MPENSKQPADIAIIGLAVMGQNLALNMADKGFRVAVFNRTSGRTDEFLAGEAGTKSISGYRTLPDLVAALSKPRKVLLMVKAGQPVDDMIGQLLPLLESGDIVIDGGNSNYLDTERRLTDLKQHGIHYVGSGISGGEEGARHGPSIMPGGSAEAWPDIKPIFESIAAHLDDGSPCCQWIGLGGAGHYVKMVHNGIEYGDMQLIAESYQLLKDLLGLSNDQLADIYKEWNRSELDSYLIDITSHILAFRDDDGEELIDKISDRAGQKGTGKWTVISSADFNEPVTLIAEAVYARLLSARAELRAGASQLLKGPSKTKPQSDQPILVEQIRQALYISKIVSYAQGFSLIQAASDANEWHINMGGLAHIWRAGCIIRSRFLTNIEQAYQAKADLANLLFDQFFSGVANNYQTALREVVSLGQAAAVPLPAMSSALAYFDGLRSTSLPTNLIQAQRDYFGAHTYERVDKPAGQFFHTDWAKGEKRPTN